MQIFYCHWQKREGAYFHSSLFATLDSFLVLREKQNSFCSYNSGTSVSSQKFYRAAAGKNHFQMTSQLEENYNFISLQEIIFQILKLEVFFLNDNTN